MPKKPFKILIISEANNKPSNIYIDKSPKLTKGFIRRGHDVRNLSYSGILSQLNPFSRHKSLAHLFKRKADSVLCCYVKNYEPDIVIVGFAKFLDPVTIQLIRNTAPAAVFIGIDGDLWPSRNPGRIETALELDMVLATNNGSSLNEHRQAGVKKSVFMPNVCDPDTDFQYIVNDRYRCDILWTGKVRHKNGGDEVREEILQQLQSHPGARVYGCLGYPKIEGLDYFYAISGAKIGISINADNTIPLYHSDRFTHYAACGTMVLAKRVPQTELLMEDKKHVVYFDTADECMELVEWYLNHEDERQKIAETGMKRCHAIFEPTAIAGYILDLVEKGVYCAPWGIFS